ncbi:HCP-like protein, partial [Backusella circina FSU 941]
GTEKRFDKALAWYILAAIENNSYAQHNIGNIYHGGKGVPTNYLCAMKWYLKSSEQNNALASNNIGVLFENGQGVPRDKHKALEWY